MRSLRRLQEKDLIDDGMCKWASEFRVLRNSAAHFGNRDEINRDDVYDASSDLVIIDAASLETITAIHFPDCVPNGFHGN